MAESGLKLSVKSKETILITAIAIVAASLIFFVWPGVGGKQVKVPRELILGQEIDSSNVRLDFPDLSKIDFVQYRTDKSAKEILQYLREKLINDRWTIVDEGIDGGFRIVASHREYHMNIDISVVNQNSNGVATGNPIRDNLVSIILRQK